MGNRTSGNQSINMRETLKLEEDKKNSEKLAIAKRKLARTVKGSVMELFWQEQIKKLETETKV